MEAVFIFPKLTSSLVASFPSEAFSAARLEINSLVSRSVSKFILHLLYLLPSQRPMKATTSTRNHIRNEASALLPSAMFSPLPSPSRSSRVILIRKFLNSVVHPPYSPIHSAALSPCRPSPPVPPVTMATLTFLREKGKISALRYNE